ncbi:NAD(P)/FAD-dependent oxidoreductase [Glutamicibacter sp. MNS18]|uniref:phytoene desaturase family protein n=1 Tax=Glutamicibacter sp. MNS18 TaxID=2989817 RepID=UPI0022357AB1|nr:NAD(P)/FAD-dependent oxidoreductase [Glutamicibacter sp. MNS18]MCW4465305.1 NAD(P)/FAD-dependent oxidoreductase [Glutamicibacter sp. MNS18]
MTADYVIIGSGINALVAAAELSRAGASVTMVEERQRIGGFIDSGELTKPGFIHDTYSSWHPLFVAGAAYAELGEELHRRGLRYRNLQDADTPWVCASTGTDSRGRTTTVLAHRDPARTAELFEFAEDRDAYRRLMEEFGKQAPVVFAALGNEANWPGLAKTIRGIARLGYNGAQSLVRQALMSGRNLTRSRFKGNETDQLWAPWLLHAGLGPDQASGGIMLPVMAASMHQFGLPVVEGGAANFVRAFESLLLDNGVQILTGTRAEGIEVLNGRASAVRTTAGTLETGYGVLASVSVPQLYSGLLKQPELSAKRRAEAEGYLPGRAAMQVHLALNGPVPWTDQRLRRTPLIHISTGSDSTAIACAQAEAGLLPAEPTIVVGQQSLLDPTRAPQGKATLWIQLQEVPFRPLADAAGELECHGEWTEELSRGYLERVLSVIETHAPGLRGVVLASASINPRELERQNRNAVAGDPYGGATDLYQNLFWRPAPRLATGRSPVKGLWHIGAATHPGPGLGGGSGHLVAQQLIRRGLHRKGWEP